MGTATQLAPEDVLAQAEAEPASPKVHKTKVWPYLNAVHVLRQKDWAWKDIMNWVNERTGLTVTDRKLLADHYFSWCKESDITPVRYRG